MINVLLNFVDKLRTGGNWRNKTIYVQCLQVLMCSSYFEGNWAGESLEDRF